MNGEEGEGEGGGGGAAGEGNGGNRDSLDAFHFSLSEGSEKRC